MSRMIISLVISLFLVMTPIVGQFIDQQTASPTQESLHIENTENSAEKSDTPTQSTEAFNQNITASGNKASTEGQAADINAISAAGKKFLVKTQIAENEMLVAKSTSNNNPDSIVQPEASVKPKAESDSAAKPAKATSSVSTASKETPAPKSVKTTTAPQTTKTPEAGATPKPAATPKSTATPKPDEPPKAPAQTQPTTEPVSSSNENIFDTSKVNSGTLGVRYHNTSGKRVKLMVEKGDSRYTYNLDGKGSLETFPLQSGNGEYTVSIMENTTGSKYRYVISETVRVKANDSNSAYLGSIQMISWNSGMAAIKKAADLTSGVSGDEARVKKIYNYVVKNIRYDSDKLNNLPSTYIPSTNDTYKSKSGICYDFASLTAAMLRSIGIPTKLIMGYADGVTGYHAWNEVYIDGKWKVIDTSYDSQMREGGASYSMFKSKSSYQGSKTY